MTNIIEHISKNINCPFCRMLSEKSPGTFLVRKKSYNEELFVLSFSTLGTVNHVNLEQDEFCCKMGK